MTSKSARRMKSAPAGSSAETASRAGPLEELFPRASRQGVLFDHWAEGRFLVEHGARKGLEEGIAARFPAIGKLAEFSPDLPVSAFGFLNPAKMQGTAAGTAAVHPLYTTPGQPPRETGHTYG